jgi:hypothetical protein
MDNFYSFYKKSNSLVDLPYSMRNNGKETPRSSVHHQSIERTTSLRKSGKMNMVGRSHGAQMGNNTVEKFINSPSKILPNLSWVVVKPILAAFNIKHDPSLGEPYTKALNRTGAYIKYNPENEKWTLMKK